MNDGGVVREARIEDLDEVVELMHARRLEYERYSPVFWRVSATDRQVHRPFLELMINSPDFVSLVAGDVDGCLFALRRGESWLVDDFAMTNPDRWSDLGAGLLDAAQVRTGLPRTVVCGQRDRPKGEMLRSGGFELADEWWVGDPLTGSGGAMSATFDLVDAPPVYDPGGKVAMTTAWDHDATGLEALREAAGSAGAVLVIVPCPVTDDTAREVLTAGGFSVSSEWYRKLPPPPDVRGLHLRPARPAGWSSGRRG